MHLRDDILTPIPGENPSGIDLRYNTELLIYDKIREACRQDDALNQGDWQSERKTANFPLVIQLAQDTLATISKDLQLAAWLNEALLQTEGFSGLRQGLELCLGLLSEFWDTVYPIIEDGDRELRAMPLNWLGSRLDIPLRSMPITIAGYSWFALAESRLVGYEEQALTDLQKERRSSMIASGKLAPEVFDQAFAETPKTFYGQAEQQLDSCIEALTALDAICTERFEDDAPSFDGLKIALTDVRHAVHQLFEGKRRSEPDPVDDQPMLEPTFGRGRADPSASQQVDGPSVQAEPLPWRGVDTSPAPEPVDADSEARLLRLFLEVPQAMLRDGPDTPWPAPSSLESVGPGESSEIISEKTAKEATEVAPNERKSFYHAEATALSGSLPLPLSSASKESASSLKMSPDAETTNLGDATLVSVFYATDRMQLPTLTGKTEFGQLRSLLGSLHYGRCEVSIPKAHQVGKLETPSILRLEFRPDPRKHIVLNDTFSLEEREFFGQVKASVGKSAAKDAFVFVHGYNVSFEDAARRTGQIAFDLNFIGAPIFYSWPSQGKTAGYTKDETNITWSTPHLQRFLTLLAQNSGAERIHILAHSMGNRAVCDALKMLSLGPACQLKLTHLVLAAPDIDADTFRELAAMLQKLSGRITLYESSRDLALMASKKIHGNPRAGEPLLVIPGLDTIDASAVDTDFLGHSYFSDNWPLLSDIYSILFEDHPPERRFGLSAKEDSVGRYYSFRT